jgi:carboxylate-amine ligase
MTISRRGGNGRDTAPSVTAARPPGTSTIALPTVTVEEQFMLVWPDGDAACLAPQLLGGLPEEVRARTGVARYRVETETAECAELGTVGSHLSIARGLLAEAAADLGARLLAVGTLPFGAPGTEATCACHVTVGLRDRDLCVAVLERLQPWLPTLLALTGNSPLWRGRDTGWSSHRFAVERQAPSGLPRPRLPADDEYDRRWTAGDARNASVLARLSPGAPAVEIRLADTCPSVPDAVLLAGLCRALVWTAVDDELAGRPASEVPPRVLGAVGEAAARRGLTAQVLSPATGRPAPAREVLDELMVAVTPALEAAGDADLIGDLLAERLRGGSGADRQRTLWRVSRRAVLVQALANGCAGVGPALLPGVALTPLLSPASSPLLGAGPWSATA